MNHHTGKYLSEAILKSSDLELAFVWNRSKEAFSGSNIPKELLLEKLEDCSEKKPDLIVEVAHPTITANVSSYNN